MNLIIDSNHQQSEHQTSSKGKQIQSIFFSMKTFLQQINYQEQKKILQVASLRKQSTLKFIRNLYKSDLKNEAKIQIMKDIQIFKIFKEWKAIVKGKQIAQLTQQIQQQEYTYRLFTNCFHEWKRISVEENKAHRYYIKRRQKAFFKICQKQLQLRIKSIYVEELRKIMKFPTLIKRLKIFQAQQTEKEHHYHHFYEVKLLKRCFRGWKQAENESVLERKKLKLAKLFFNMKTMKKAWRVLTNC